jgi:hypothetical protein
MSSIDQGGGKLRGDVVESGMAGSIAEQAPPLPIVARARPVSTAGPKKASGQCWGKPEAGQRGRIYREPNG